MYFQAKNNVLERRRKKEGIYRPLQYASRHLIFYLIASHIILPSVCPSGG